MQGVSVDGSGSLRGWRFALSRQRQAADQLVDRRLEAGGEQCEGGQARLDFAPLDLADLGPVESRRVAQARLPQRPLPFGPPSFDRSSRPLPVRPLRSPLALCWLAAQKSTADRLTDRSLPVSRLQSVVRSSSAFHRTPRVACATDMRSIPRAAASAGALAPREATLPMRGQPKQDQGQIDARTKRLIVLQLIDG